MTDLLDLMRPAPIVRPVDPDGPVVQDPLETHEVRAGWRWAEVQLHQTDDGLWMWGASLNVTNGGFVYRVGPKWGRFATRRADAVEFALAELTERAPKGGGAPDPFVAHAVATLARQMLAGPDPSSNPEVSA